jgi:hypothetical protein
MPRETAKHVHPLTLAVVRHKLLAVSEEMVETMVRTSFSPLLNQSRDFSAVVPDTNARVLAQAELLPSPSCLRGPFSQPNFSPGQNFEKGQGGLSRPRRFASSGHPCLMGM